MKIYVDADACPVRNEVIEVAARRNTPVYLVSNKGFRVADHSHVSNIVVSDAFDAADDWIAERLEPGDLVITGDIPLADRALKSSARAMDHKGKQFTESAIGMAMAMRDLMSDLRAMGEAKGGGPAFSKRNRSDFRQALELLLR